MQRPLTPTFGIFGLQILSGENESMCYESHTNRRFHHTALPAVLNVCEIVIEGHSIAHHTRSFLLPALQNLL